MSSFGSSVDAVSFPHCLLCDLRLCVRKGGRAFSTVHFGTVLELLNNPMGTSIFTRTSN